MRLIQVASQDATWMFWVTCHFFCWNNVKSTSKWKYFWQLTISYSDHCVERWQSRTWNLSGRREFELSSCPHWNRQPMNSATSSLSSTTPPSLHYGIAPPFSMSAWKSSQRWNFSQNDVLNFRFFSISNFQNPITDTSNKIVWCFVQPLFRFQFFHIFGFDPSHDLSNPPEFSQRCDKIRSILYTSQEKKLKISRKWIDDNPVRSSIIFRTSWWWRPNWRFWIHNRD